MGLAQKLEAGETVFTGWSVIPDAMTVEALAGTAFDAVTLDMQHGGHHEDSVLRGLLPLFHAGKPGIVRIPVGRFDMASRALDFGAEAVIAPMVNSLEDARRFAAAMKYPPVGERSWGPTFAIPRSGGSVAGPAAGNAATLAFAMIETRGALDILDDVLAVPGIDGVFVGPADFSLTWSGGAGVDISLEDMMEAIGEIARRARAAGRHAGIYVADPALAGRYVAMGFRLLALGYEMPYLAAGVDAHLAQARASIS